MAPVGPLLGICMGVTGFMIGGMQPVLIAFPILLEEIGPVYAGTAGGFVSTMQLLGAVLVPSCVAAPLAGENMTALFGIGGVFMLLSFLLAMKLPELGRRATASATIEGRKSQ